MKMHPLTPFRLLPLLSLTIAWTPPSYPSWDLLFSDPFLGPGGTLPSQSTWSITTGFPHINNQLQTYLASPHEVQLSGGSTL